MKRYVTTLALLLLLLTLLIPGSLPTATAAPPSETEDEYHPGVGAKELTVYKQSISTRDCGELPASVCTPNGPNDPNDQEFPWSVLVVLPKGTTIEEVVYEDDNNQTQRTRGLDLCNIYSETLYEVSHEIVDLVATYPSEFNDGRSEAVGGYLQGTTVNRREEVVMINGCENAIHSAVTEQTISSGRYTLTDAPDRDGDTVADYFDDCPFGPGPVSNDGCPETADLALSLTAVDTAYANEASIATLTVTNQGPSTAQHVDVSITLPDDSRVVPEKYLSEYKDAQLTIPSGTTFDISTTTWSLDSLSSGEQASLVFTFDVVNNTTGPHSISASINASSTTDPNQANNTVTKELMLAPPLDTDNDSVSNLFDLCPERIGLSVISGCPSNDTDGDGLNDVDDSCPSTPGPEDQAGCPTYPDPLSFVPEGQSIGGIQSLVSPATRQSLNGDPNAIPCTQDEDNERLINLVATTEFGLEITRRQWVWFGREESSYDPIFSVDYKWLNVCYKRNADDTWYLMGIVTPDGQLKNDAQTIRDAADIDIAAVGEWTQLNAGSSGFTVGAGAWEFELDNVRFQRRSAIDQRGVVNVSGISRTRAIFPKALTGVGLDIEGNYRFEWNPNNDPLSFNISMIAGRNGCMFFTGEPDPPAPEQCQAGNW